MVVLDHFPPLASSHGASVELKTIDDVDLALHELSWLDHAEETLAAACKVRLDQVKTDFEKQRAIEIEGKATTIGARRELLEKAVQGWAKKQLPKHLERDSKTLNLPHGTLSLRVQPLAVAFNEGVDEKDVLNTIERKVKLTERIATWLSKVQIGSFWLSQIVTLKPQLNKSAIKSAWASSRVGHRTMQSLGIQVTGGEDELSIKPAAYHVAKPAA
jgi:hypothetical protein